MLHFLQERLLHSLQTFQTSLSFEICDLRHRQALTEENVDRLKLEQLTLHNQYVSTIQVFKNEVAKIANDEIPYVFRAPRKNPWFGGRLSELQDLANLLPLDDTSQPKVNIAAVCGLGGVGKTSLATEFAQQRKDFYTGGVYWFSGEDDTTFENSVYDVATRFGTQSDSFGLTFSATLAKISRNKNPWLIVLDNMDQLSLSSNVVKLISGPWQHDASGHILIITRRKPTALANDIRDFNEGCCLSLQCFGIEEGKKFLFHRIRVVHDEEMDEVAVKLVQQLGGLPLALEQAGAYIKSLPCTISQYLELYDKQHVRLLNRQKATSVSVYDSPERLAVRTTWHLNFEHIKQTVDDGKAASRFLYASAFLNPNEIQKDIINIGEPPIEDEEFSECVKTTLGRQQVVKLLTDFSLFKEILSSNLSVHHLVQEVIQDNLNPEEELRSINDAIRMLHYAFQKCPSPDELLSSERKGRASIILGNQSRFYKWHKLCLHSYDLVRHLKRMIKQSNVDIAKIFQAETARIVYESAIHLSANSKHDEAREVANFANDILNLSNQQVPASSLFPHIIPLPEIVRRRIQYSSNTPLTSRKDECRNAVLMPIHSVTPKQIDEMRLRGNDLFKKCFYNDALKMYSDAIDKSKNTAYLEVRLLSNRASVYLKLGKYDEALRDAEDYILQRPKCWRGYTRKALALVEMKNMQDACVSASIAFYYERNVFRDFEPFRRKFGSSMEKCLFVCRDTSDLSAALWNITNSFLWQDLSANSKDLPVIILENGDYLVSPHTIDPVLFNRGDELPIGNCILVGSDGECSVTIDDDHDVSFGLVFSAYNIRFHCRFSCCHFLFDSIVKLTHCSFTSSNDTHASFCSYGKLKVDFCKFYNCIKGGLLVEGDAEITNSEFYDDAVPLEVRRGGRLVVRKSKLYGNKQGLRIGEHAKECVVEDCELYDNMKNGIFVTNCASDVLLKGNRIYDNDECGIIVDENSNVSILENEILRNNKWGILIDYLSQAVVKKNKIKHNQCGGIGFVRSSVEKSVIEHNDISFNSGPGIHNLEYSAKDRKNKLQDNKEVINQSKAESEVKICYCCKKPNTTLRKCGNCFTAQYSGKQCQKSDWKNHKEICNYLVPIEGSVIEHSHISSNFGSGIIKEGLLPTKCRGNKLHDNKEVRNRPTAQSEAKLCYYCRKPETNLKKCAYCFTAQYCGKQCQKSDWNNHKKLCDRLLSNGSIVLNYVQESRMRVYLSPNDFKYTNYKAMRGAGLLPVGPKYCPPPNTTTWFIVKMSAGVEVLGGKVVRLYDRSLKIDGSLTGADQIYDLVWQHGAMGQANTSWKKLFMWVKGPEDGKLRVFINEFPPYQNW
jgi:parallel beta-helix repeat protein